MGLPSQNQVTAGGDAQSKQTEPVYAPDQFRCRTAMTKTSDFEYS